MRRRNNTDWLQDDVEQALKRAVKNHNAKVDRERKKDPDNPNIPAKVSYSSIKANIRTKGGAERQIKKLQAYTQKAPSKAQGGGGIQWRQEDSAALQKAVKNYNAKIKRLEKNDPLSRGLLPDNVTMKEMRQSIKTRADFNRKIKELQSYTQRGGEWQYNWTARDDARLQKAVDNFNAKLEQLKKANPEIKNALPGRASITQYKKWIATPEDLNRELSALRGFIKKGAEEIIEIPENKYNLKITKWQMEQMESRAAVINERRAERRAEFEKLEATRGGEGLGYKAVEGGAGFGSEAQRGMEPIVPFTPSQGYRDVEAKYRTIMQGSMDEYWIKRDAIMKKNYLKALDENFTPADVADIKAKIKSMTPKEFYTTFLQEQSKFETIYKKDSQYKAVISELRATWLPNK